MREYITKEQAMRRFKPFGREIPKDMVFEVIASLQEEIVRCKDCKHYGNLYDGTCEHPAAELGDMLATEPTDFCSCGERSEE